MRGHLVDCMSGLDSTEFDRIMEAPASAVVEVIERDYTGGVEAFCREM